MFESPLDYTNTLEFIKRIGDVGEAKMVFRNHTVNAKLVTTNDVRRIGYCVI